MDREKVIKGLEICSEHGSWHGLDCEHNEAYKDCPYRGCETGCIVTIAKDAIALIKEQEAEIEQLNRFINEFSRDATPVVRCKDCKHHGEWSCAVCINELFETAGNWFCAHGERK